MSLLPPSNRAFVALLDLIKFPIPSVEILGIISFNTLNSVQTKLKLYIKSFNFYDFTFMKQRRGPIEK